MIPRQYKITKVFLIAGFAGLVYIGSLVFSSEAQASWAPRPSMERPKTWQDYASPGNKSSSGNVGIGTTVPTQKLDVAVTITVGGTSQIYWDSGNSRLVIRVQ